MKQFHLELLVRGARVIIFSKCIYIVGITTAHNHTYTHTHTHTHTPQDGRMAVADTTLGEVAADVPAIGRVSLRTRKTLRGHLAKIYAMHWASDSR